MQKLFEFLKTNRAIAGPALALITAVLIAVTGVSWVIRKADPDEKPGVIIVYEKQPTTTQK